MSVCLFIGQPSDFELVDLHVSLSVFSRSHSYSIRSVVRSVSAHGHVGVLGISKRYKYALTFPRPVTWVWSCGWALFSYSVFSVTICSDLLPSVNIFVLLLSSSLSRMMAGCSQCFYSCIFVDHRFLFTASSGELVYLGRFLNFNSIGVKPVIMHRASFETARYALASLMSTSLWTLVIFSLQLPLLVTFIQTGAPYRRMGSTSPVYIVFRAA